MIFNQNKPYQLPNQLERMRAEDEYFSKFRVLSYSGLKKLLEDPIAFYKHYVLGIKEDRQDKSTLEGSLTHMLLFTPDNFDNEYAVSPSTMPSDNPKKVILALYDFHKQQLAQDPTWPKLTLRDYENEIHDLLGQINLYQSLKDPEARFMKVADVKGTDYWEHLIFAEGKTIIDDETHEKAQLNVDRIKSDPEVLRIMGMLSYDFGDKRDVINEEEMVCFPEGLPFGLRGYLDNLVIDHAAQEIRINDLKNTSKTFSEFSDAIELWKYWIQVVIYHKLVEHVYAAKYPTYKRVFRFIVLDKSGVCGPIRVTEKTLEVWKKRFEVEVLNPAIAHFEKKDFMKPSSLLIHNEVAL